MNHREVGSVMPVIFGDSVDDRRACSDGRGTAGAAVTLPITA